MHYAVTALVLTVVYVSLALIEPPLAESAATFYLIAVLVLVAAQRARRGRP